MKVSSLYKVNKDFLVRTPLLANNRNDDNAHDSTIRTAIAVGSPSLFSRMDSESEKTKSAVRRYYNRMKSRCTPFGMFAGVSSAQFDKTTDLQREPIAIDTVSMPDMSWLIPVLLRIEQSESIKSALKFSRNPELLIRQDRVCLVQKSSGISGSTQKSNLKATPALIKAITLASNPITIVELASALHLEFGGTLDSATRLCNQLIQNNFLLSELRIPLSDWHTLEKKLFELADRNDAPELLLSVLSLLNKLKQWDESKSKDAQEYLDILEEFRQTADSKANNYIKVDSVFGLTGKNVSEKVGFEIAKAAELLLTLSPMRHASLATFKLSFASKYQIDREVPILELLNPQFGLGSPYHTSPNYYNHAGVAARLPKLLELAVGAISEKKQEIELTEQDLKSLQIWQANTSEAPISMDIFAAVVADSREDIDRGDFMIAVSPRCGEIGAGRTSGRFANALGKTVIESINRTRELEQLNSKRLLVDVACWPLVDRLSNVAVGPFTRQFCVNSNCVGDSTSTNIPLSEIVIGIANDQFYARWIRTGQLIAATSNNMLNPQLLPDSIRFLLDIANDGLPIPYPFEWGAAATLDFLPRLKFGRIILSPAQWNLRQVATLALEAKSLSAFESMLTDWRQKSKVPDRALLSQSVTDDSPMLLDFRNRDDISTLYEKGKKLGTAQIFLSECLSFSKWHTVGDEHYSTEIVAEVIRADLKNISENNESVSSRKTVVSANQYMKTPGSDWLYIELNCGRDSHHEILRSAAHVADTLSAEGAIVQWFFVPYMNPWEQLRIRYQISNGSLYNRTLPVVCSWASELVQKGLAHSFSIESYDREIERYGGVQGTEAAEKFFCLDSKMVTELQQCQNIDNVMVGLLSVLNLVDAFYQDPFEKLRFMRSLKGFESKQLASNYFRQHKNVLIELISDSDLSLGGGSLPYQEVKTILAANKPAMKRCASKLWELEKRLKLSQSLDSIVHSLIHMHCVRLFGLDRNTENLVRAILERCLSSICGRLKQEEKAA